MRGNDSLSILIEREKSVEKRLKRGEEKRKKEKRRREEKKRRRNLISNIKFNTPQ